MLKNGTFCYVVPSCRASPAAARAVGKIVEVVAGPHGGGGAAPPGAAYYDVRYHGRIFYCLAEKLRAISDPDADIGAERDGSLAA